MTPEQLLQECEKMAYTNRMRYMVELGRQVLKDTSIASIIAVFAHGDVYQRTLALQSCYGSRDSVHVLRALNDPSRGVRRLALSLIPFVCNDTELQNALQALPLAMKDVLVRRLYHNHNRAAINVYLEKMAAQKDRGLKRLLPFGSREVVERLVEQVIEQFELPNWRRLARLHPSLVLALLKQRASASSLLDQRLILQVNTVLPILTRQVPDLTLDLVRVMLKHVPLQRLDVQQLVSRRPNELADLVLQADELSQVKFDTVIHRLDTERIIALFTRQASTISHARFHKLAPQQRLALYQVCERGWRSDQGILPYAIVAALPVEQRIQEGRRHLSLPALVTNPLVRMRYAAFLPWDELLATLDTSLRSPDADLRGAALEAIITAVRYQRGHLTEALQLVLQRRNEQDPVRCQMLTALSTLPYGMWHEEHLSPLAQIIRDTLDASDLSMETALSLERIVIRLLPFHPTWCATQLPVVYREQGHANFYNLDSVLSDADMKHIVPVILPVLKAWQTREREYQLVQLLRAFGRRLRVFDEIDEVLEAVLNDTLYFGIAENILQLFSAHRRQALTNLIPRLLEADKSYIVLYSVQRYLHQYRQDLLTPFLGQRAYKGRFSTGNTRFVLPIGEGFFRWTPRQQTLFAQTLLEVARDKDQPTYVLLYAIRQLSAMPAIEPDAIIALAHDERLPVRDTALRALGKLDAGQGIAALFEAMNDERARIAIYALREILLNMSQEEALNHLRTMPLTRVTVAKEVVRLMGDLASAAAFQELLVLDQRDLHRDVRVALLRALWSYTEKEQTWQIFTRAAQSPDAALVRGVVSIPADGMSSYAQKHLVSLTTLLLQHAEPKVRIDSLRRCTYQPVTDYDHVMMTPLLTALNSSLPDECALAARALFATYTAHDAVLVGDAIRSLLPNRRALQITIDNFLNTLQYYRQYLLPTVRTILAALSEDRHTISLRVGVIILGLPWIEVAPELVKLSPDLHADALSYAKRILVQAATRPDANLFRFEQELAASSDERLRRLALEALVAQSRQIAGWSDERIARLQTYMQDPSPLVAEAAQFTFTS